jgi:hypothetical protein
MSRLPDFIIIGAMKCATSTLHDQLSNQSGIFMTEPKEPYFFSNDDVWEKGLDWYSSLYNDARENDICGESSTHYTKLPTYPRTIERMRAHLPCAKLIYVIRHPFDRLISHYIHDWSEKIIDTPIDDAVKSHSNLIDYSKYAMQIHPFLETYGADNILLVFFEHLLSQPQDEIERIARFIGYPDRPQWLSGSASNVSSRRLKSSPLRDAIVWNPVSTWLRRRFVPKSTREWIKGFWQMKQRPQLSRQTSDMLESVFDRDLYLLGKWIGTDLTCQTFKQVAKTSMPNWSNTATRLRKVA